MENRLLVKRIKHKSHETHNDHHHSLRRHHDKIHHTKHEPQHHHQNEKKHIESRHHKRKNYHGRHDPNNPKGNTQEVKDHEANLYSNHTESHIQESKSISPVCNCQKEWNEKSCEKWVEELLSLNVTTSDCAEECCAEFIINSTDVLEDDQLEATADTYVVDQATGKITF